MTETRTIASVTGGLTPGAPWLLPGGVWALPVATPIEPPGVFTELAAAVTEGSARVGELPEPEVETLLVETRVPKVLALAGTLLSGGRQDRAVRETALFETPGAHRLPVRCVEQGRWAESSQPHRPRAASVPMQVRRALRDGEQGDVWREVEMHLSRRGVASHSRSLAHDDRFGREAGAESFAQPPDGTTGVVFFGPTGVVAAEWIADARIARILWDRWLGGMADFEVPRTPNQRPLAEALDDLQAVELAAPASGFGVHRYGIPPSHPRFAGEVILSMSQRSLCLSVSAKS